MTTTSDRALPAPDDPPPVATTPATPPTRAASGTDALRRLIRRVHFYAGVLVAPFLAILCLTGIAYVFTPQINDLIYPAELLVTPQDGPAAPLDRQVAAARAAYPGMPLTSVKPAYAPDRTTFVVLTPPDAAEGDTLAVTVNPYTAHVTGALPFTHGEPPPQAWLRTLHSDLHLGTVGAWYSEIAASWLPVLFIGGLVLWIGRRRARRRELFVPDLGARAGRRRIMSWHGSVGIWLTASLVFISLTGLTWSTYAGKQFQTILTQLDARTPKLATDPVPVPATPTPQISVGEAEAIGRSAGLVDPLTLTPPAKPGARFVVAETASSVPLHRDRIALDPYTGEILQKQAFADYPFLAKLTSIGIAAHTGTLFGLWNQIALTAMALGILAVLFWGYRMWWQRRPTRGGPALPLERRGALRSMPQPMLFAVVLTVVLASVVMPLFGVSLVLFLVVDAAAATIRRRRAATVGST